ncbi:MAG: 50S ribosomal protein L19 [Armatimonadota bacterium]|nr:MAG: 50S ribosomal protein L19 [Armatimonadota bacterium]
MQQVIRELEKQQMKPDVTDCQPGDTVRVHVRVSEGGKERVQVFEGTVIGRQHGSVRESIIVRKMSHGVGVERTFLIHSPKIDKIEVTRRGDVRRAKLYYLRGKVGKATRIKERRDR